MGGHSNRYSMWGGEGFSMRTCGTPQDKTMSRTDDPTIARPAVSWTSMVYNWKRDLVFILPPLPVTPQPPPLTTSHPRAEQPLGQK